MPYFFIQSIIVTGLITSMFVHLGKHETFSLLKGQDLHIGSYR